MLAIFTFVLLSKALIVSYSEDLNHLSLSKVNFLSIAYCQ